MEVLEEFESNSQTKDPSVSQIQFLHHDVLIKLCLTILSIFKKIFNQLRKDFSAFFGSNDVFFLRVFYMNTLCSYTEIYNAWSLLTLDNQEMIKKKKLVRAHSLHSMNVAQYQKHVSIRQKASSAVHRSPSITGISPQQTSSTSIQTLNFSASTINGQQITPPIQSNSYSSTPVSNLSTPPPMSDSSPKANRGVSHIDQSNISIISQGTTSMDTSNLSTQPSTANDNDIDVQLYHTLRTVINMVNVVYSQLTQAITKSAIASTASDQLSITPTVAAKTKELTDTCFLSMELSKVLKERLRVISSNDLDLYLTNKEKLA